MTPVPLSHAPPRDCRDAGVYVVIVHDMSTPPPLRPAPSRHGRMVNGQVTEANNKEVRLPLTAHPAL